MLQSIEPSQQMQFSNQLIQPADQSADVTLGKQFQYCLRLLNWIIPTKIQFSNQLIQPADQSVGCRFAETLGLYQPMQFSKQLIQPADQSVGCIFAELVIKANVSEELCLTWIA